jgi:hypothetical protein
MKALKKSSAPDASPAGEWDRSTFEPGGRLILYPPDEKVYRGHCACSTKTPTLKFIHGASG